MRRIENAAIGISLPMLSLQALRDKCAPATRLLAQQFSASCQTLDWVFLPKNAPEDPRPRRAYRCPRQAIRVRVRGHQIGLSFPWPQVQRP
jgi:hypothetical protein